MATYFIRISGSDSNNGTSAATAWRTWGKALGATGIASSDIVWIGAGQYRETIVIACASALTSETQLIGDTDGVMTGDTGEVQLTTYLTNDETLPSNSSLINLAAYDFLTIKNIVFIQSGSGTSIIGGGSPTSTDIKLIDCTFNHVTISSTSTITTTIGFGIQANWLIDRCVFFNNHGNGNAITLTLTTGTGQDYDANILIRNCTFYTSTALSVTSSGSSNNEGGGVTIANCTIFYNVNGITTGTTRVGGASFTYPVRVFNNLFIGKGFSSVTFNSSELGNLIENYNIIYTNTVRTNTKIGSQSISDASIACLLHLGQEYKYLGYTRPFLSPTKNSPFLATADGSISLFNDFLNNPRPLGNISLTNKGSVTSANTNSFSDSSQLFGNSNLMGLSFKIVDGLGKGQTKTIRGNTNTTISGDGQWITQPNSSSKYVIYQGPTSTTALASTGSNLTLQDNFANWGTNFWQGATLMVTSGVASGQNMIISGNSPTVLSGYYNLYINPASGDAYSVFWGGMLTALVSTGSNITVTDNLANWQPGFWTNGWRCMITAGVASGANFAISGNSSTVLSGWNTLAIMPASGDTYKIFQNTGNNMSGYYNSGLFPPYGQEYIHSAMGCYELNNTAFKETGNLAASGTSYISLLGNANHSFQLPVSGATTLSVMNYKNDYYQGNVGPTMKITNASGFGIADAIVTGTQASGVWSQMSLSFTGVNPGVITVILQSNTTGIGGIASFDSFSLI